MAHSFSYANDEISVTGITDVKEFGDTEIVAALENESITVQGSGLKIVSMDIAEGKLRATGKLALLKYGSAPAAKGFLNRLFK